MMINIFLNILDVQVMLNLLHLNPQKKCIVNHVKKHFILIKHQLMLNFLVEILVLLMKKRNFQIQKNLLEDWNNNVSYFNPIAPIDLSISIRFTIKLISNNLPIKRGHEQDQSHDIKRSKYSSNSYLTLTSHIENITKLTQDIYEENE